jgi:hypothetical protein
VWERVKVGGGAEEYFRVRPLNHPLRCNFHDRWCKVDEKNCFPLPCSLNFQSQRSDPRSSSAISIVHEPPSQPVFPARAPA